MIQINFGRAFLCFAFLLCSRQKEQTLICCYVHIRVLRFFYVSCIFSISSRFFSVSLIQFAVFFRYTLLCSLFSYTSLANMTQEPTKTENWLNLFLSFYSIWVYFLSSLKYDHLFSRDFMSRIYAWLCRFLANRIFVHFSTISVLCERF